VKNTVFQSIKSGCFPEQDAIRFDPLNRGTFNAHPREADEALFLDWPV
jgi:hypothetical protein